MSLLSLVRSRSTAVIVTAVVVTAGFQIAEAVAAPQAPSAPVTVTREPLASAGHPRGAPPRTLGLSRVTVMPGTTLALHHHPGTQIGYVDSGVLTYTVEQGRARLMAGTGDDPRLVRVIRAGQTAKVHPGQWLIEQPTDHHHAQNRGTVPVIIYLATLFEDGEPASIPG
ncbi:MAG TPA: cupin domain-containing protein [Nocardioides sp.]|nr:cupin domain-containing protein [Nocardioides sp.]